MSFARDNQTIPAIEQLERTQRWYKRLQNIYTNTTDYDADEIFDHYLAFFQNCFAIRDWLKEFNTISSDKINELFNSNSLKLCRDICTGSKHLKVKRPSVDPNYITPREYNYYHSKIENSPMFEFKIFANGKRYDLFELATVCIKEIIDFFTANSILSSDNHFKF